PRFAQGRASVPAAISHELPTSCVPPEEWSLPLLLRQARDREESSHSCIAVIISFGCLDDRGIAADFYRFSGERTRLACWFESLAVASAFVAAAPRRNEPRFTNHGSRITSH